MNKYINPQQISHIKAYKGREGVYFEYAGWVILKYVPEERWFFNFILLQEERWCKDGVYKAFSWYTQTVDTVNNWIKGGGIYIKGNSLFTLSFIDIFCGEKKIHREYFKTYEELEKHLKDNYSNISVRYETT